MKFRINDNLQQLAMDTFMHFFFLKLPNATLGDVIIEAQKSRIKVGEKKGELGEYPFFTSGEAILRTETPLVRGRHIFLNTGGNADVKFYAGDCSYSTDTWCISAVNGLPEYIYLCLLSIKSELGKKYFQGTGLKHLQKDLLKKRPIYIPNGKEAKSFNSLVTYCFDCISANIRENNKLERIRDRLLPSLMSGQAVLG